MAAFGDIDYSYLGVEGLTGDRPVRVSNLGRRKISYTLPELNNLHRTFNPAENGYIDTKVLTFHEIYMLNNIQGGPQIIFDNLQIKDNEVREALDLPTDPEFDYDVDKVRKLVQEGTQDEILDALDFGPFYIAQWMKTIIVSEGLNDYSKRKFFEGLFRMDLDNAQDNLEWATKDSRVGADYARISGAQQDAPIRQRRARSFAETELDEQVPRRRRRAK